MKRFSANAASMKKLEADGWTCTKVEQNITASRPGKPSFVFTRDAYGFGDILACAPSRGIMLVQTTTGDNFAARIAKVKAEPRAAIWLASKGRIQVHGWAKRAGAERECRILEITAADTTSPMLPPETPAQQEFKRSPWVPF